MGFYKPAQLVRDAREHGVEVRQTDINYSNWDCSLEKVTNKLPTALQPKKKESRGETKSLASLLKKGRQDNYAANKWRSSKDMTTALRLGFRQIKGMKKFSALLLVGTREQGYSSISELK